jgi:predicted enzyme related to lactoylglutathione lyase
MARGGARRVGGPMVAAGRAIRAAPMEGTTVSRKLVGATIWSEDLNNLLPFYRDVLKLTVAFQAPGFVVFGDGAAAPTLALGTHSEVKGSAADPYRHMVGIDSADLDADYRLLTSAGVEFVEPPTEYDGLRIATLKDPEGNLIQLFQPKS